VKDAGAVFGTVSSEVIANTTKILSKTQYFERFSPKEI
jgi:hypothetical protein